ncbi:MAG: hypothetical protein Q8Q31_03865 [Nanoarchaeota archaeon]|nr:hypothetical protein [Nanoarchaeota archaeon]
MKSKYFIYSTLALFFISFSLINAAAEEFSIELISPTPADNSVLNISNEFTIAFNTSLNPVNVSMTIEDSSGNPTSYDLLNVNTPYMANFTLPLGSYYYWVSADNNGSVNMTEARRITTDAYELIVEQSINDPNAIDNDSFINNATFNTKYIKASTNLVSDYLVEIFNSSNNLIANFETAGKSEFIVKIKDMGLADGQYSYYVFANYSSIKNITSELRNFSIDTAIPAAENMSLSLSLPFSMNNDESKTIQFNSSFNDLPVNLTFSTWNANTNQVISSFLVNGGTILPLDITVPSGLPVATYNLSVSLRDAAGNSKAYDLGSFSINEAPSPPANPGNSGSPGGSAPLPVVESPNVILNNTNLTDLNFPLGNLSDINETGNSTIQNKTDNKNFFNAITGAVTGVFQNRSFVVIIVVLVILVLAWIFSGFLVPAEEKKNIKEEKISKDN